MSHYLWEEGETIGFALFPYSVHWQHGATIPVWTAFR